ncbi:hypothetical protein CHLRE_07g333570v5 [Chlamydomonas reinhardtii]|uniref:Reverse transcriptase domain-containing protein n=1 Tax=Chlamydomonas reinhardtii TaxID=3055 RepID=A0A2K3DK40_CHLRE|nr:uncharacterized protein CHLRE_07g333570v5 [Chlamydomonas reinhardtii]PNW80881.1 hypothetical protein CHLRE_07g333570v5 [Chlamydomonas reinhardtii]
MQPLTSFLRRQVEQGALRTPSANGKAPGSDGVPYEVYKVFWALLGPRLCAAAAAAFAAAADAHDGGGMAAALPASWREGIITLIYKGKSLDRAELASYWPITLLNCDFKMVSKAVSACLQPALDAVVDELQTAFITGRWIGDNALYLQGLIEWMRLDVGTDGTPRQGGALYFLDIEKAYDRVHRQWLYASAEGLGFGPRMLRWIRLLTANGSARVCVNGMLSDAFPVLNGLPQGSTASPPLWVIRIFGKKRRKEKEPGPGVLPLAMDGAWQPACVLQHRKPRHLWTFEERAAYDAASPGDRAGAWPRAPYFLAPEAGVVVHPEHCRIAGVSLADYKVQDVRRAITAANPAAPLAPARPAAMPCPAPTQQAGDLGPQPAAQSRLAEREAEWQRAAAQLTTTAAQHFHNNPVALDPWLHRTFTAAGLQNKPARELQSYASPSQQSGEGPPR